MAVDDKGGEKLQFLGGIRVPHSASTIQRGVVRHGQGMSHSGNSIEYVNQRTSPTETRQRRQGGKYLPQDMRSHERMQQQQSCSSIKMITTLNYAPNRSPVFGLTDLVRSRRISLFRIVLRSIPWRSRSFEDTSDALRDLAETKRKRC